VVERMGVQFRDKSIVVSVDAAEGVPPARGDFDRFSQVLTNLLGNALQYTPEGGSVHVSVQRDHEAVRVSVRDSGVGLAPEDVERVFQRFYRVDKSRARASGGSGVGLTIARSLVEAQGGRMWAESPGLGRGSSFIFTAPIA
jgi:histidine kinase